MPSPPGCLGILALDTAFPRIPGDIGAPETFPFPVRHATVAGAYVDALVHRGSDAMLPAFIDAGRALAAEGCIGIATTCGFLVRWQRELAAALPVPVLTSALLQVPWVQSCLPLGQRVGVVTYSAQALTRDTLQAAGADPQTPVVGVDPGGYFARTIREGAATLDRDRMAADVVAAALRLRATTPALGAIVLECANMPPYRDAVAAALALPVFDAAQAIAWFHAGIAGVRPHARGDLW